MTNGLPLPAKASPKASMARRSAAGGAGEVAGKGNVVLERQVDDAVRRSGGLAQGVEVVERAGAGLDTRGLEGRGGGIGAGEPGNRVAGGDQLGTRPRPIQPTLR